MASVWGDIVNEIDDGLCFVLMPFSSAQFDEIYEQCIQKPVVEKLKMRCLRADDIFRPGIIMKDVWEHINRAAVIIAELTDKNANVYYELGMAHALGKDVIQITHRPDTIPFNVQGTRHITYTTLMKGYEKLAGDIERAVRAVVDEQKKQKKHAPMEAGDMSDLIFRCKRERGMSLEDTIEFMNREGVTDDEWITRIYVST